MQRFSNILFVNDPPANTKRALKRALQLARVNQADLTITSILQELPRSLIQLQKTFRQLQDEELKSLLEGLPNDGVNLKTKQVVGTPFLQIIKQVMHEGHDLVIKPAEGRGGMSSILFGSTDLHLLRKCPCPVWIIKPSQGKKYARILAAVDPNPGEEANAELNTLILDLASSLARRENSQLGHLSQCSADHFMSRIELMQGTIS
jgi:nucleotide-binding universal stress UspA family protein